MFNHYFFFIFFFPRLCDFCVFCDFLSFLHLLFHFSSKFFSSRRQASWSRKAPKRIFSVRWTKKLFRRVWFFCLDTFFVKFMVWIYMITSLHRRLFQDGFHAFCWQSHPHAQAQVKLCFLAIFWRFCVTLGWGLSWAGFLPFAFTRPLSLSIFLAKKKGEKETRKSIGKLIYNSTTSLDRFQVALFILRIYLPLFSSFFFSFFFFLFYFPTFVMRFYFFFLIVWRSFFFLSFFPSCPHPGKQATFER